MEKDPDLPCRRLDVKSLYTYNHPLWTSDVLSATAVPFRVSAKTRMVHRVDVQILDLLT